MWRNDKIQAYFEHIDTKRIKKILLILGSKKEKIVWMPHPKGSFSVNQLIDFYGLWINRPIRHPRQVQIVTNLCGGCVGQIATPED